MKGPTTIGRYRLLRRIGAGGMGVVYEAEDSRDDSKVALKVLLPHAAEEADGIHRFKREFRALARLRHPNVVRVFDAGIDDDTPFIAMELVAGKDVRTYLRGFPEGPVRDRELVRILRQLFGALAHIHVRRIVHRDLKPENILVSADGRVKLMDFGVARVVRAPTSSSGLLGTFAYMSPEQVTTGEADARSDLYAIGVLVFELLTGKYPFPVEPPAAALHHHVNTPPELVRHINPKADPQLSALAHKLLQKDPMDRPQSAEAAMALLADQDAPVVERADGSKEIAAALFVPRFVARADEVDALEGLASDAAGGRGRVLLVEGPGGVGKTRLVEELRQRAKRRAHVLVGQSAPEGMQAYGAFQGILDGIATIAARATPDVAQRVVGRDVALVSLVSPRLAALGGPVSTTMLDAAERKLRLHKAMVGVIGRLALTKPVILVLEDIHWADSLTLELIWDAARTLLAARPGGMPGETVCPMALVLTRRQGGDGPDPSDALIRRLTPRVALSRRALTPLSGPDVAEMLRTMTGVGRARAEVVEALLEESQGLPLMVQEVISAWVTEGVLERRQGHWRYRGRVLDVSEVEGARRPAPSPVPSPAPVARADEPPRRSAPSPVPDQARRGDEAARGPDEGRRAPPPAAPSTDRRDEAARRSAPELPVEPPRRASLIPDDIARRVAAEPATLDASRRGADEGPRRPSLPPEPVRRASLPPAPGPVTGRASVSPPPVAPSVARARSSGDETSDPSGTRRSEEVVLARLRALEPGARALAVRLALLGRVLPAELVTAVAGLTEDALLDAIDELVRTRVLVEEIADNGVRYRFAYDAIRNALSADLDERKRAGLHLELARRIERAFRDSRAELAHVLARHFRYAGVPARAVRYLMLSARGAASRGDLEGALKRLDDAAVILETGPRSRARASRALRLLLVRLDLLLEFGRPKEALERADPALAAQARGPLLMKAELLLRRAAGQFALGRFDEALASVGRIGRPMPSRSVAARALSLEGRTRMARGEYAKARAVLEAARDVARGAGLADIADELDATIGMALLEQGEYLAALERLEEALRRARAAGRTRPIVDIMGHIGLVHAARAADTAALACYREALELAEARGVRSDRLRWAGALGVLLSARGDHEDGEEKLREALDLAIDAGNRQAEAHWRGELGVHYLGVSRYDRAGQELQRSLAIARDIGFRRCEARAEIHLGAVLLERDFDRLDEAEEHLQTGLERAQEIGDEEVRILGLLQLARLRRAEGDAKRAQETLERAEVLAMATQNLRLRAQVHEEKAAR
jgi:tetratricopeptide (TPR) repeat protein